MALFFKFLFVVGAVVVFSSCASSPMIQPQINGLVVAQKFDYALKILEENKHGYGERNKLLYLLDYGFLSHVSGEYQQSIQAFEEAKRLHRALYTVSVTNELSTWLVNDTTAPFRPEDFEIVLVHIFQALNYAALNNIEESLVEARQVDGLLAMINSRYSSDQRNVYREDAFARLMMGIFYEARNRLEDDESAYLEYKRALHIYDTDYRAFYGIDPPLVLKKRLLDMAQSLDNQEYKKYKDMFSEEAAVAATSKKNKARVYLIQYDGFIPIKHETSLPIPLPNGIISRLSFPSFDNRIYDPLEGFLRIEDMNNQPVFAFRTKTTFSFK